MQADRARGDAVLGREVDDDIFSHEFLLERPLLARDHGATSRVVLLIDEVDKADAEFEAFLLEVLSDFQVTCPSSARSGAPAPARRPHLERTRELSEALKRRCLHLYVDFPDAEREARSSRARCPRRDETRSSRRSSRVVQRLREARAEEGAVDRRDARLGARALRARHRWSRRRGRPPDAEPAAQARRRHPQGGTESALAPRPRAFVTTGR